MSNCAFLLKLTSNGNLYFNYFLKCTFNIDLVCNFVIESVIRYICYYVILLGYYIFTV